MHQEANDEANDLLDQLALVSVPTKLARRALEKASIALPNTAGIGTDPVFWAMLVAKYNLAMTLGTIQFVVHRMQDIAPRSEEFAVNLAAHTGNFLEICSITVEVWEYMTIATLRDRAHIVTGVLEDLTGTLISLMSGFCDNVEGEAAAKEIKVAIGRLQDCRKAA